MAIEFRCTREAVAQLNARGAKTVWDVNAQLIRIAGNCAGGASKNAVMAELRTRQSCRRDSHRATVASPGRTDNPR
jgi:hypothetical protein